MFQSSPEFIQAFKLLLERPAKLLLTTGEMFPTSRLLADEVEGTEMAGVEHLGQYVFEMTKAKVEMLKRGEGVLPPQEPGVDKIEDDEMNGEGGELEVEEEPEEPQQPSEII